MEEIAFFVEFVTQCICSKMAWLCHF